MGQIFTTLHMPHNPKENTYLKMSASLPTGATLTTWPIREQPPSTAPIPSLNTVSPGKHPDLSLTSCPPQIPTPWDYPKGLSRVFSLHWLISSPAHLSSFLHWGSGINQGTLLFPICSLVSPLTRHLHGEEGWLTQGRTKAFPHPLIKNHLTPTETKVQLRKQIQWFTKIESIP